MFGPLNGITTRDPAFGMEAVWIEPGLREHAQSLGYTVVDAATVIATHLSHLIQTHAHELFGHEEAEQLRDVARALHDVLPSQPHFRVRIRYGATSRNQR